MSLFVCETVSDLAAPEFYLASELRASEPHPMCTISGSMLDAMVARARDVQPHEFSGDKHFEVATFISETDEEQEIVDMMHRLSLVGHEEIADEPQQALSRLIQTQSVGEHVDLGHSNIVNLTLAGQRITTNVDRQGRHSRNLAVGTISVVPSITAPYYLETLPHEVSRATPGGLMFQCSSVFQLRNARVGLPA